MNLLKKAKNFFSANVASASIFSGDSVYEIDIYGFGPPDSHESVDSEKGTWEFKTFLMELYRDVLKDDPNWHYFIEGKYNHLRFSFKFWPKIENYLTEYEAVFSDPKEWVDEQGITRKYQHIFQQMFHTFSELAVQGYDEKEIEHLLDRVIHCFMNHQAIFLPKSKKYYGDWMEPVFIVQNAIARAMYIGRIQENERIREDLKGWYRGKLDEYRVYSEQVIADLAKKCGMDLDKLELWKQEAKEVTS